MKYSKIFLPALSLLLASASSMVFADESLKSTFRIPNKEVLECHSNYAKHYSNGGSNATASEISIGASAECKSQFDSYIISSLKAAEHDPDKMVFKEKFSENLIQEAKEYLMAYTINAVIHERSFLDKLK